MARIGALIGLASGAILGYQVAACEGKGTGEQTLSMAATAQTEDDERR